MCFCDLIPRCNTCCGLNLRSASLLVGVFQLIFCFIHIPLILLFYCEVSEKNVDWDEYYEKRWLKGVPEAILLFGEGFWICTSIALVIGVMKQHLGFIGPYLYFGLIFVVLFVIYIIVKASEQAPIWFTLAHCLILVWQIISWFTVQFYYQQVDDSWRRRVTAMRTSL